MSKSVIEKSYDCFNNQDLEGYMSLFHEEFTAYDLTTNELIITGKDKVYETNKEPVLNPNKVLKANNVVVRGNVVFFYKTFTYKNYGQTVICEIENGLIKTAWVTTNK